MVRATIVKRRGRYVCDHRFGGIRLRPSFSTRNEAEAFRRELLLRAAGLMRMADTIEQISIATAIRKYDQTITVMKGADAPTNERTHFKRLYDFLLDEKKLFWLNEVRLMHLEEFQAKLRATIAAATVNRHFNTYKHFFNKCAKWKLLEKSPAVGLQSLPEDPSPRKLWTEKQMASVITKLPSWAGDVLFFIAVSMVRPGKEVERLTWGDLDLTQGIMRIKTFKGTGKALERFVPIAPNLVEFLKAKKESARKLFRAKDSDQVFVNSIGNSVESGVLDRLVRSACRELGYEGLVPYGLRHTAFTDLAVGNESLEKIRRLGGHSALTTTQKYLKMNVRQLRGSLKKATSRNLVRMVASGHKVENESPPFVTTETAKSGR